MTMSNSDLDERTHFVKSSQSWPFKVLTQLNVFWDDGSGSENNGVMTRALVRSIRTTSELSTLR